MLASNLLFIFNTPNWTVYRIAKKLQELLPRDTFRVQLQSYQEPSIRQTDLLISLWWQQHIYNLENIQCKRSALLICEHYSWRTPEQEQQLKLVVRRADALLVLSQRLAEDLQEHQIHKSGATYVVPDGVDIKLFSPRQLPEHFTVAWLGKSQGPVFAERKGLSIIMEACQRVGIVPRMLDATTGAGLPHEKVPQWLQAASVVICASSAEGTPCTILEGASMGRVPLTTMVGIADQLIVHGESGLIVDRTVEAFAQGIQFLRTCAKEKLAQMGIAARARAERWSWDRSCDVWAASLQTILQQIEGSPARHSVASLPTSIVPVAAPRQLQPPVVESKPETKTEHIEYLFAVDRHGWSLDNTAIAVSGRLLRPEQVSITPYARALERNIRAKTIVAMWWGSAVELRARLEPECLIGCVYENHIWLKELASFQQSLQAMDVLVVANARILQDMQTAGLKLPAKQYVAPDGVDRKKFTVLPLPEELIVGWCGNSSMGGSDSSDLKGLGIIREACAATGMHLVVLDTTKGNQTTHANMASHFYSQISVYACASLSEGGPNPPKEAAACGRPCITTTVGDMPDFVRNEQSGILVERTVEAFAEGLRWLKQADRRAMSRWAQQQSAAWDWNTLCDNWRKPLGLVSRSTISPSGSLPSPGRSRFVDGKSRVLLMDDVPNWAFWQNCVDWREHLDKTGKYIVEHYHVINMYHGKPLPIWNEYAAIFSPYHRWPTNQYLPWDRALGSLRALWFTPERPGPPTEKDIELVNRFRAFHVVTRQNYEELAPYCPNVMYLTNPVNMTRFPEPTQVDDRLVCSWNGNAEHQSAGGGVDVKGFKTFIQPVCNSLDYTLVYADYNVNRLAPREMPGFYLKANTAICMSLFEGASNSVMEAMASGLALITTDCGNAREMQQSQLREFGDTGILLVDRSQGALSAALRLLASDMPRVRIMGNLNREEIKARWSWSIWAARYEEFLCRAIA